MLARESNLSRPEHECYVVDSYALIAYLEGEPGQEQVKALLRKALKNQCRLFMSTINLGEVLYIVERERGLPSAQKALARIDELPIDIVDANRHLTLAAAHVKAQHSIAYADCFAYVLAQLQDAALVTGDPELHQLGNNLPRGLVWLGLA
jgi:ribonuclease VapC